RGCGRDPRSCGPEHATGRSRWPERRARSASCDVVEESVAQLLARAQLDLANALAGEAHGASDVREGVLVVVEQPLFDDGALTLVERLERGADRAPVDGAELALGHRLLRRLELGGELHDLTVLGRAERNVAPAEGALDHRDLLGRDGKRLGELLARG